MKKNKVMQMVTMAMLAALSIVLVMAVRFIPFPATPFLEYDPADIPILIGTFLFGPVSGLILTVVVSVIQALTVSSSSGLIGALMHIFATGSFVLVAGLIFKRKKSIKQMILAAVCGVLTMTATMVLWNLIFTPLFMGTPLSAVLSLLVPFIIPFNLLKGTINAVFAILVYKALHAVFKKLNLN